MLPPRFRDEPGVGDGGVERAPERHDALGRHAGRREDRTVHGLWGHEQLEYLPPALVRGTNSATAGTSGNSGLRSSATTIGTVIFRCGNQSGRVELIDDTKPPQRPSTSPRSIAR